MNDAPDPDESPSAKGDPWLSWIVAVIVLPSIAGAICFHAPYGPGIAIISGIVALFLHLGSSMKLDGKGLGMVLLLYFGGWLLMAVSFFVGCLAAFPKI